MTETMTDQETPQNLLDFLVANNARMVTEVICFTHRWNSEVSTISPFFYGISFG